MEFRILGPLEVGRDGDSVSLGGLGQRALLAILILRANKVVGTDSLIDLLWGDEPPDTALHILRVQVSRLRKVLEVEPSNPTLLVTSKPGYVLRTPVETVDAARFEMLVAAGRSLRKEDPARASKALAEALALWRGEALADLALEPFAAPEIARLEELRLSATEDRIDAELAQGNHTEVVGDLRKLASEHPLRERITQQLMVALYRSGRQTEALDAYQSARARLASDLGIDPGSALQALERAVLQHDPSLDLAFDPRRGMPPDAALGDSASSREGSTLRPRPSSRRRFMIAALATVVVAAITIPLIGTRGSASTSIDPNSVGVLDPNTGEVLATIGFPSVPGAIVASVDSVWVANPDAGTVARVDPLGRAVVDTVPVGENPTGIAVGADAVWVVDSGGPSLSRISPDTNSVVETIGVGNGPAGVAVGAGSVWVTNRFDGTVSRIDPHRGEVVETIPVGLDPRGIAIGSGSVWVALAGSNALVQIDPQTNDVTRLIGVGNAPGSVAVSADGVWVVNSLDDTVSQISPDTNTVVDTIEVGNGPSGIVVVDGMVWVANEADGTVSRIEPGPTPVSTTAIGSVPTGLTGVNGELWISVRGTATSHRGGTLRMLGRLGPHTLDQSVAYNGWSFRVLHLIGDGLVAYEPIGGNNATLVPDLAMSVPTPTDDGRTYTFELRPEIRYSNGEVVAPSDFRRALERAFRLNGSDPAGMYGAIVGAEECGNEPETCDLSRGIVTDDVNGTIAFHLVDHDPEFLDKLTMPFAYPVPLSVPSEEQTAAGIVGTGPYMLETPMTPVGLAMVRNPEFHVWSPAAQPDGYVDRIEWTFGVRSQAQIDAVVAGDADVAFEPADSARLEELFVRFAAQVQTSPNALTKFVVLGTETPPFDDVEVRRAINLAVDRNRIVQILGGERTGVPTCQQIPPNFPGFEPYCPYTSDPGPGGLGSWTAPNLEEARRIVRRSGTEGMGVTFEFSQLLAYPQGKLLGEYLVELLDELGYHGSWRYVPPEEFYGGDNEFQMAYDGWAADYPAASNFITPRFSCNASWVVSSGFCDPRIDTMIDRATQMQVDDPAAAGARWAAVDRAVVDEAPFLWLANEITVEFVSERVGNYQLSLQWGVLLNQLWVR